LYCGDLGSSSIHTIANCNQAVSPLLPPGTNEELGGLTIPPFAKLLLSLFLQGTELRTSHSKPPLQSELELFSYIVVLICVFSSHYICLEKGVLFCRIVISCVSLDLC